MMWLRVGQDGRSWAPTIRTALPWKQELRKTSTTKKSNMNYYEALEKCYEDCERFGKPEPSDISPTRMMMIRMMLSAEAAKRKQREDESATASRDAPKAEPMAARGAAATLLTTSATKMGRTTTQRVPGVAAAMNNPVIPATTTQTMTAASERERFASWQRWRKLTKSNRNAAAVGRDRIEAAATETAAIQTEATKAK